MIAAASALTLERARTALLVIDVQKGFLEHDVNIGPRSNPHGIGNIAALLAAFRAAKWDLFHIRHASTNAGSVFRPERPGFAVMDEAREIGDEPVLVKSVNSGFIGTDLEALLRTRNINTLVMCGATANHCVETTVRMGGNLGFKPLLVGDAIWAYGQTGPDGVHHSAETVHSMTLANIANEFGRVVSTSDVTAALHAPALS